MAKPTGIERYALYGEPAEAAEPHFMHVERIPERSGAHHWSIKPHTHSRLHQLLLLTAGGGAMQAEATLLQCAAPALLVLPAGTVHAFEFSPQTDGLVITVADSFVEEVGRRASPIADLLAGPLSLEMPDSEPMARPIAEAFHALAEEFTWAAPGRMLMVEAHLLRILVGGGRLALGRGPSPPGGVSGDALLVERFRRTIEENFRGRLPVGRYARLLGVSESRLSAACHRIHGEPAVRLVQKRRLVEAQRHLIYTNQSIAEIGFFLGYEDPSYFSRFFMKLAGMSPSDYRRRHGIGRRAAG